MAHENHPEDNCHVVSVDVHDGDLTILTARAHGKWFYAEADPERIRNDELRASYLELARTVKKGEEEEEREEQEQAQKDSKKRKSQRQKKSKQQGSRDGEEQDARSANSSESGARIDRDSGYASEQSGEEDGAAAAHHSKEKEEARAELRSLLVKSLRPVLEDYKTIDNVESECSLKEWYEADMHFFNFEASKEDQDLLRPVARDDLDGPKYIHKAMTPHIPLPKYLRHLSHIPWYSPDEIQVLTEADDLHLSIHPTVVQVPEREDVPSSAATDRTRFLKLATQDQSHAVKRELRFLHLMQKQDLYSKGIHAPRLEGLVSVPHLPDSHAQILGFLLTNIPSPCKSLTSYMDPSISQSRRNTWAMEVDRMVSILHENGLVWGDAKADNFVVDKNGKLWMIDFGGGYTEGWIERELADTEEGDDVGTEKIVNGMKDPENCTVVEEDEEVGKHRPTQSLAPFDEGKRKRDAADDGCHDVYAPAEKKVKS